MKSKLVFGSAMATTHAACRSVVLVIRQARVAVRPNHSIEWTVNGEHGLCWLPRLVPPLSAPHVKRLAAGMSQRPKAETVYAVEDYYDGPESGFANFRGHPHRFEVANEWLTRDRTSRRFRLTPVDVQLLRLALDQQQLWSRWNASYRKSELPVDLPYLERVLPEDLEAYRRMEADINECMGKSLGEAIYADGRFFAGRRVTAFGAFGENLRVVWSRCRSAA